MSKSIPPGATVNKKWLIESLSKIAENQNPIAKLQVMLNALLDTKKANIVFLHFCAVHVARTDQLAASSHRCHHRECPGTFQSLLQHRTDAMESMDVTKRAV